jgi:hypothetical protein
MAQRERHHRERMAQLELPCLDTQPDPEVITIEDVKTVSRKRKRKDSSSDRDQVRARTS